MRKWKGLICIFLGALLVGTAGCTSTASALKTEISDFLNVSEAMQEEMSQSIQAIDKTAEGENVTVHVQQTFGNNRELYVLYDVTFAESIDLSTGEEEGILPQTVTLSGETEVGATGTRGSVDTIAIEGQTITYLSYFESRLDQWPEGDLVFNLGTFEKIGPNGNILFADEVHEFSWAPTNQSNILKGDILSSEGEVIGRVSLSPFSLRYEIDSSEQTEYADFVRTIFIVDHNGETTRARGFSGGGAVLNPLTNIKGSITFKEVLDLSNVSAVQIDGYTVAF